MAVKHQTITVTDVATDLTVEADTGHYANNTRHIRVQNTSGTAVVYIGGPGVTATNYGLSLAAGAATSFDLVADEKLYAICDALASAPVRLLHTGL